MKLKYVIFSIFLLFFSNIYSQLSKKHYLPPITTGDAIENQYIYISTPKSQTVSFKIIPVGKPKSSEINGTVSNTKPYETNSTAVGDQLFQSRNITSVITNDKGYIIEADDVIYVSVRMRSENGFQAGAIVSKGNAALGTNFRMGGLANNNPVNGYLNFVSVMATKNNTRVTFDDLTAGISIDNYTQTGTNPITILLNENETYIVAISRENGGDPNDLIGTLINSDKPIVVNSGSATGSFAQGSGRDYGIDQIVDASKVGKEYIFVRGYGEDAWENVLIIAHEDDTEIKIADAIVQTINKGQYYVIEGNFYNTDGNMYVETSKPAFAYQGIGGLNNNVSSQANQGMFFVPPLSCENRGDVNNIAYIDKIGNDIFDGGITIVTNKGATVSINGLPIASFTTSGPFDVDGNSKYETYRVSNLDGNVAVKSSEELYCAYFNYNGFATSGSFYSGFPSAPEINFENTVTALGNCIPNITLTAANTDLFDGGIKWEFYDENTLTWQLRSVNASYKPIESEPGKYRLVGSILCSNSEFISTEIPVSICPDDFDGDLIIDNLDPDIDNDGILNCNESLGNAIVNLANVDTPIITLFGSSPIVTEYSETEVSNSFSGDNIGNFESIINPEIGTKLSYKVKFPENVNIKFSQNKAEDQIISNGEFFVLRVGPSDKNVTLLDSDDQLLIDTDFDGIFETGVTNISASEIHFKYANNTTGANSTFEFVANQINEFEFKHQSSALATPSTFHGNIGLTCFTRDSDLDGIEDMFDLDSDNDGIPDFYETSADTDSDGVLNYLDLDADNDGIYDVVEAGNSNLDIDLNGVIDNAITYIGINGLVDVLETVPDDKILAINYTIVDTDVDGIFNFVELDADNDACFDVFEAGFTDQNNDGYLGNIPIQTNSNGKVINTIDGYTSPNSNYITNAPIVINTPFENFIFCENDTDYITIDSTADGYQWQVSTDNGAVFNNLANNARYNGTDTKELEISDVPLTFNNYQYKVLMSRTGNSCINQESNAIILTVNPMPIPKENPTTLKQCDSDPDKQTTFNLTLVEINISDTPTDRFQYFATELAAIAGTPKVSDKTSYFVDTSGEAWVKTISEFGCSAISKIDLTVSYTPNEPYEETFEECDDFSDADGNSSAMNDDTDGITFFDLSSTPGKVSSDPDIIVELYETEDDRIKSLDEIRERLTMLGSDLSKYRNKNIPNTTGNTFPIFYKLISKSNNDCQGIGQFYLQINSVPTANQAKDMPLCDSTNDGDGTNGIAQTFDLESRTSVILGTQSDADYTVTYHLSKIDANSGNDPQASFFTNTIRDLQTIYVRVTDDETGCFTDRTSFDLIVNPLPIANFVEDLEICDDNTDGSAQNGFSQEFDLELRTEGILGFQQDPTQFSVTYHASLDDAQAGILPLVSPFSNSVPFSQIIYARVYNSLTGCANGISNFNAVVNPEPTFTPVSNLSNCDNDADGDDTNGMIQNIDLDSQIPLLLGTLQDPDDFIVTFHISQTDASSGIAPIASPYTNTDATETMYVRIQNYVTSCVNDDGKFDVIVNTLPDFEVTSPQILCLNDTPENIYVESPLDIYSYVWRDINGNTIGEDKDNLDVYTGGNYTVTATTTNGTNCSRTKTITVSESDSAILLNSFVTIVDEGNNIGSENNSSILIDIMNNNLGPGDYQFKLINDNRNTSTSFQDEPLFENLEGGFYTIVVRDINGCIPDAKLQVSVLQFPKFFTPNGDGSNDTWIMKGVNKTFYPNSSINIFNRYGKLVAQLPIDGPGWNGTYNSKKLPSDDYWYNVTLIPADPSKPAINKTGNFSLLRK